jgi:hypothetical protein
MSNSLEFLGRRNSFTCTPLQSRRSAKQSIGTNTQISQRSAVDRERIRGRRGKSRIGCSSCAPAYGEFFQRFGGNVRRFQEHPRARTYDVLRSKHGAGTERGRLLPRLRLGLRLPPSSSRRPGAACRPGAADLCSSAVRAAGDVGDGNKHAARSHVIPLGIAYELSLSIECSRGRRHVATRRARANSKACGFSCARDDLSPCARCRAVVTRAVR